MALFSKELGIDLGTMYIRVVDGGQVGVTISVASAGVCEDTVLQAARQIEKSRISGHMNLILAS